VDELTRKMGKRATEIPKHAMQALQNYTWPGNVRELEHAIEGAIITARGKKLNFELPIRINSINKKILERSPCPPNLDRHTSRRCFY
jgi:transcriptional regulator with PAS, ATPase and Fis domain